MNIEERKLKLIASVINTNDLILLSKAEEIFEKAKAPVVRRGSFKDLASIWTEEEAEEFKRNIEEGDGCGHPACLYKKLT